MKYMRSLRQAMMLTCKDVNLFLAEYLDGVLDERTVRRFEKHVSACGQCQAYLDQYKTTIRVVGEEAEEIAPPEELVSMTLDFLRKHNQEPG